MPFLTLNGIEVPIASARRSNERVGDAAVRAFNGTLRRDGVAKKRAWEFTTTPLDMADAAAMAGLIEGLGEHWGLEGTPYSDAGLLSTASTGVSYSSVGTVIANQGRYILVTGQGGLAQWAVGAAVDWTWLLWTVQPDGASGTLASLVIRSDGARWRAGVRNDAFGTTDLVRFISAGGNISIRSGDADSLGAWATGQTYSGGDDVVSVAGIGGFTFRCDVASGLPTSGSPPAWPAGYGATVSDSAGNSWRNIGSNATRVADMVWLPFKLTDAQAAAVHAAWSPGPWSALPNVVAAGTFAPPSVVVQGRVDSAEQVQYARAGTWRTGEVLTFTLTEV